MLTTLIGLLASITSTISLLPQIYYTFKTKSCHDVSMGMLINFAICSLSWILYGMCIDSLTVSGTNVIMLICSLILIGFKLKYKKIR